MSTRILPETMTSARRNVRLAFLVCLAAFLGWGCSDRSRPQGVYSNPRVGRLIDFSPNGLFAKKSVDHVTVGHFRHTEKTLELHHLSYPKRGQRNQWDIVSDQESFRLSQGDTVQDYYPEEPGSQSAPKITGLWRHQNGNLVEFTEFTPWNTVIWYRKVEIEAESYIGGGWAKYQLLKPNTLKLSGMEYRFDLHLDDEFTFELGEQQLSLKSTTSQESRTYQRITEAELREHLDRHRPQALVSNKKRL